MFAEYLNKFVKTYPVGPDVAVWSDHARRVIRLAKTTLEVQGTRDTGVTRSWLTFVEGLVGLRSIITLLSVAVVMVSCIPAAGNREEWNHRWLLYSRDSH